VSLDAAQFAGFASCGPPKPRQWDMVAIMVGTIVCLGVVIGLAWDWCRHPKDVAEWRHRHP